MDNLATLNIMITIFAVMAGICGIVMLLAKQPLTSALGLLGVLLFTAGIYGLIGEHFIATIQLVVYAGAIMVLFIFSIMLFNLKSNEHDARRKMPLLIGSLAVAGGVFGLLVATILKYFETPLALASPGSFSRQTISDLGGNSLVLAHSLFTQHFISFEAISLALLIALVGAVVLAKRRFE